MKTRIFILAILLITGCSRHQNHHLDFKLSDSAFIKLIVLNCSDTTEFFYKTSPMLPCRCVIKKTYLTHDTVMYFSHKTTKPDFIDLGLRRRFQTYVIPGDTLKIVANLDPNIDSVDAIQVGGELGDIFKYFDKRHKKFGNWHIIYALANLYDIKYSIERAFSLSDSICSEDLEFLNTYNIQNQLPYWFYETMRADIEYNKVLIRPQFFIYRNYFFNEKIDNPQTHYIFDQIKLNNPKAKFSDFYYQCIDTYLWVNQQQDLEGKHGIDRGLPLFERSIPEAKEILKDEMLEFYLAWKTSELFTISRNLNEFERVDSLYNSFKNQFENEEIIKIINNQKNYMAYYFKGLKNNPFTFSKIIPDN